MTCKYALKRLLEHGSLTRKEITEITGWPRNTVNDTIQTLCSEQIIRRAAREPGQNTAKYELK